MPLALLLQKTFNDLSKGIDALSTWIRLVQLDEILLERARSAFLVHWFGSSIPLHGPSLQVVIANIEDLHKRYQALRSLSAEEPSGLNLTEPVAGMGGAFIGMLLSPTGILALSIIALKYIHKWYLVLLGVLGVIVSSVILPAFLVGGSIVLLPIIVLGGVIAVSLETESIARLYDLVGALTELAVAARSLIEILLGPREKVRNPLLQQILLIGDKLAALFPFLIALFAILITRFGKLLEPLAIQLVSLYALISETSELVSFIMHNLIENLIEQLYTSEDSPFHAVLTLLDTVKSIIHIFLNTIIDLLKLIKEPTTTIGLTMGEWIVLTKYVASKVITDHPLVQWLRALIPSFKAVGEIFGKRSPSPSRPGFFSRLGSHVTAWLGIRPAPPAPKLPEEAAQLTSGKSLGSLIKELAKEKSLEELLSMQAKAHIFYWWSEIPPLSLERESGTPYTLSKTAKQALERARHPTSIFEAQRQALHDLVKAGGKQTSQLERLHEEEKVYRSMIFAVIHRVLMPQVKPYVAQLEDLFKKLDKYVYSTPEKEIGTDYPVRYLEEESSRLQPLIHRLRIHVSTVDEPEARAWGNALKQSLEAQAYLLPATS